MGARKAWGRCPAGHRYRLAEIEKGGDGAKAWFRCPTPGCGKWSLDAQGRWLLDGWRWEPA